MFKTPLKNMSSLNHLDSFNHEANVSDAHEVSGLVNGVDGLHMAGYLWRKQQMIFVISTYVNSYYLFHHMKDTKGKVLLKKTNFYFQRY